MKKMEMDEKKTKEISKSLATNVLLQKKMVENEFQTSKLTPLTRELLIDTPCEEKSVIKKTVEIHSTISTCISATRRTRIRSRALFEIDHQEQENQFPVSVVSSPPSSRATSIAIGGCTSHTNSVPTVERLKMNNRNNKPMQYSNTNEKVEEQEEEEEDTLIIRKKWKHRLHHLDRQTHISDSRRKGLGSFVPPTSRVLLRSMSTKSDIKSSQQEQEVQQLVLPTVSSSNHPDLNVISPKTVHQLIQGQYKNQLTSYHLIDCRFEFEFQGGSLQEAISMNDPTQMEQFLLERPLNNCTKTALIFFCEFSANRAPKMLRHLRNLDRWIHADQYPILFYPQLYLIDGGYKNCFETCQAICQEPIQYLKMQDKAFVQECKIAFTRFRRQWKQHKTNLCASRLQAIHYGGES